MGSEDLAQVLGNLNLKQDNRVLIGFEESDDAAVVRLDGDRYLVQTVDFFTPIVDDPYQFGQIAAANSLSDIYAMGGQPLFALNVVGFPIKELPKSVLTEILQGGADKADEAGITIVGGHSINDKEPKYGLVVTGEVNKNQFIRNDTAKEGDVLVLTKPLGIGIIATAIKKGEANKSLIDAAVEVMVTLNKSAADIMNSLEVHAATDITGYGLLGHLSEICNGSYVSSEIQVSEIPYINGTSELAEKGIISEGSKRNFKTSKKYTKFSESISETEKFILSDAQTSGGLLISLSENQANEYLNQFRNETGMEVAVIGKIVKKGKDTITVHS
ncbi:MAG TPA: selenide, water dikinase SelD [Candidatus Marinimicrobia bacterium]|nr:selenide, water dikinase SelD [Candidatus Neomarinimicrobiota bacterium]